MQLLDAVAQVNTQTCYIAAGFIRNLVWDHLHQYPATPLNDIDVIYFDPHSKEPNKQLTIQTQLQQTIPGVNWQVKNQAYMHTYNNDAPYCNLLDAISYWPEKETAVAVRLTSKQTLELVSAFGLKSLLAGDISYNPKRARATFQQRLAQKQWLQLWPKLKLNAKEHS